VRCEAFGLTAIGQYWISSPPVGQLKGDPNGHATVVGLQRTLGYYVDSFAFGTPLEIRGDNGAFRHIAGQWVYPRIKATDTIKRNGFKGCCHAMHPVILFQQLLTNPKAETLMKSGDIEMLRYLCQHPQEVDKYWNSIKVAKRAGYTFNVPNMWFDYIKMLERMGRDLHSPSLVAPKDLKQAHDEYVEKVNRQRVKEQRESNRKKAEADQAKFEELKGRFIGLTMTDGTIRLHTLDSVAEYYDEGTKQHICVGSSGYYLKADTLVFTATMEGKTIATVEISLKNYSIIQCRAFANQVCEYTEQIDGIINANKKMMPSARVHKFNPTTASSGGGHKTKDYDTYDPERNIDHPSRSGTIRDFLLGSQRTQGIKGNVRLQNSRGRPLFGSRSDPPRVPSQTG